MRATFPIDETIPRLLGAFARSRNVVLSAPPGAGKTTRVPIVLLDADWLAGKKVIMLEPRRLAAQRAAQFMAAERGESVGQTVGYRIRGDSVVGDTTRIEVVTEGVLTRMLHSDPGLENVGLVVFDEYHERSIHADLGLALTLDVQEHLRNDLRILVMSATLDGLAIGRLLEGAPFIEAPGRSFPVDTHYLPFSASGPVEHTVAGAVERALREGQGDLLVFLPGQREIKRVDDRLHDAGLPAHVEVHQLYGEAGFERQQQALAPAPAGMRKVILSTSIAETSLTIDGVRIVVDSGLARIARFDPRRGMSGLVTVPVSRATADQRRGRAGRQQPGTCYRLWTEVEHAGHPEYPVPEILSTDLAPMALDIARWGALGTGVLRFVDPPAPAHLAQAIELLQRLGALDGNSRLTSHGGAMAALPVHPRLAHMILRSMELGVGTLACDVAALLEERELLAGERSGEIDVLARLHALWTGSGADRSARARVLKESRRLRRLTGTGDSAHRAEKSGTVLALAFPERVARRRGAEGSYYQMVNGAGAAIPGGSLLGREEFLAIADVDGLGTEVRVYLAAALPKSDLLEAFAQEIIVDDRISWDPREGAVVAQRVQRLGSMKVSSQQIPADVDLARAAMVEGIQEMGLSSLPWNKEALSMISRSEWLRRTHVTSAGWPDLSQEHLLASVAEWLGPFLNGMTRRAHLATLKMVEIVRSRFSFLELKELDSFAPATVTVPTGSRIALDYTTGDHPVLAVRLQEMFGLEETPTVAAGKTKVLIHLLSPAGRPVAITQDLPSFWKNVYPEVRKQLRGRYPKHHWPEDPLHAQPTRRAKTSKRT